MSSQAFDPFAGGVIARVSPSTQPQQEVIATAQLNDQANTAFNEAVAISFSDPIDSELLTRCFDVLVRRHEIFRATFSRRGDEICLQEEPRSKLERVDLSSKAPEVGKQYLVDLAENIAISPMNLQEGPLLFAWLVALPNNKHELVIAAHHVVCDGWTFGVLLNELSALYNNEADESFLQPAPSFFDFADRLEAEEIANKDADYWTNEFESLPPTLDLPLNFPRPLERKFAARRFDYQVENDLVDTLKKAAADQKVSVVNLTLAAYLTLLHRLTGNEDIVVGLPVAGQAAFNQLGLAGHLVQLLPIRARLDSEMPFDRLLQQVKSAVLDASSHANFTFGSLIKGLKVDRSRVPLINTIFNIDQPMPPLKFKDTSGTVRSIERQAENFEIFLNVMPSDQGLLIEATYATSLFDEETINSWLAALEQILRTIALNPETLLGSIPLTQEQPAAAESINATAASVKHQSVLQAIADACGKYPDKVALTSGERSYTYNELNAARTALSNALLENGVQAGDVVGICTARSEWLAIAPLAVMSVGAAYLPLDPTFPVERLQYMLDDSACKLVVGDSNAPKLFAAADVPILDVTALATIETSSAKFDNSASKPDDRAYLIYTSGSTGQPKGVEVGHGALINFLESMAVRPGFGPEDTMLAVTTLAFDISILELFLPLTCGGRVIIADDKQIRDGALLADVMESQNVTVMQATPSTWRLLLESPWSKQALGPKTLKALCGGEPLPADLAEALLPRVSALWNMFGPTETTVWSSCKQISSVDEPITIGAPIWNTQLHILDAHGNHLPASTPGEMYIGGDGLALGYHNNKDLTAQRFKDHLKLGRIYHTGDLAKRLANGEIQHLGRSDDQVKLRGYRIELGEIEHAIVGSAVATAAAVYLWNLNQNDSRIVACCVVDQGARLDTATLRRHLRKLLPAYMIPQYFLQLDELPLTPNNKVDKRALPKPDVSGSSSLLGGGELVTDTEKALAAIWTELLKPEKPLGRTDNFFDAGGHSLLALEAIRRVEAKFDIRLDVRSLIINKLGTIAEHVDANDETHEVGIGPTALNVETRRKLSPDQRRLLSIHLNSNHPTTCYNLPALWELNGPLERQSFLDALNRVLARQTALRTTVSTDKDDVLDVSGYYLRTIHQHDHDWIEESDLRAEQSEQFAYEKALAEIFARSGDPFPVVNAPLVRVKLYQISDNRYLFFFCAHQLIFDGWSFDILLRELESHYTSLAQSKLPDLGQLEFEYSDYCHWISDRQERRASSFRFDETLLAALDSEPFVKAPQLVKPQTTDRVSLSIDGDTFEQINQFCKQTSLRPYEIFLAAFTVSIAEQNQLSRFAIALPVTGRYQPSVIDLIGGFMSVLPFEAQRCATTGFGAYCKLLAADLKRFHDHQDCSFAELISDRRASSTLASQLSATFAFQDVRNRPTMFADVQSKQIDCPRAQLELPLEFWVRIQQNDVLLVADFWKEIVAPSQMEELLANVSQRLSTLDPSEAHESVDDVPAIAEKSGPTSILRKLFG